MAIDAGPWPSLPLAEWRATYETLHMWMQIVGKTRLALAPAENHWWHVVLYVTTRGLTTTPIPYGDRTFSVDFDFLDHRVVVATSDGTGATISLQPRSVAEFYREYLRVLDSLGITVKLRPVPAEVANPIPFPDDHTHASYEPKQAQRFFHVLRQADRLLKRFKGRFVGKSSPVHFFWGAMDLSLTRFSGRRASDQHADTMMREAMSHDEFSVGFWPGSGAVLEPAFYAYARPEPPGLAAAPVRPAEAYYSRELADFILPWEAVRSASSPDAAVLDFCQSTYDASADLARWDRAALDRQAGEWP